MKLLKYIIPFIITFTFISCDDDTLDPINEVEGLVKVQDFTNATHTIELFTESGLLNHGYNDITLRIKDIATAEYIEHATITWNPVMHMTSRMHSCPKSDIVKVENAETTYNGYIIFQMAENADEGWDLTINYTIDGVEYSVVGDINVPQSEKQVVTVFTGADDVKYILALIEPQKPEVAINDMTVGLFKMESMMNFPVVANYKIGLDPRMPSMDNHSSPNNEDLNYNNFTDLYDGKLSLTMTGYWKLNLMLYNSNNELLKGEEVTVDNEGSSLFLEIEF
ncbi:MAG: hypothetical protein L3J34_06465 [Flavobacteriaceae bacterium]|nr:hypothetical protein [Flavobacteriaceae bacterium]